MTKQKRTTNEKPISLHPLEFEEALAALMQTKPPPKECKPKEKIEKPDK